MSFGTKVKYAARVLWPEGKLPPGLRKVERNALIIDKLKELGHDPRTGLPTRWTLNRHLDRDFPVADACTLCTSTADAADGITEPDAEHQEGRLHMKTSNRMTITDVTGAARSWQQEVPWDEGIDDVLHQNYFDTVHLYVRQGDRIELFARDFSWTCAFLVVSVNKTARTVSTLLTQPPMFLLHGADRSEGHIIEQMQQAENDFRQDKMQRAEYEARMAVLQSLHQHKRYPMQWLAAKFMQLARAHEAGRLTRQQHDKAWEELRAVMTDEQQAEVMNAADEEPDSAATEKKSTKSKSKLVTATSPAAA
jgi:hypothetical protein